MKFFEKVILFAFLKRHIYVSKKRRLIIMKKVLAVLLVMLVMVGTIGYFPGSATEMVFADGYNGST